LSKGMANVASGNSKDIVNIVSWYSKDIVNLYLDTARIC
jgi:hypothetical protein